MNNELSTQGQNQSQLQTNMQRSRRAIKIKSGQNKSILLHFVCSSHVGNGSYIFILSSAHNSFTGTAHTSLEKLSCGTLQHIAFHIQLFFRQPHIFIQMQGHLWRNRLGNESKPIPWNHKRACDFHRKQGILTSFWDGFWKLQADDKSFWPPVPLFLEK